MAAKIVWLASFPKSGNTWFRLLLANWRAGAERAIDINAIEQPGGDLLSRQVFDDATLLCSGLLPPEEIDRLRPGVYRMLAEQGEGTWYVKIHEAYRRNIDGEALFGGTIVRAAIYIVRDPRDVASSLAAHCDVPIERAVPVINSRSATLASAQDRQPLQLHQPIFGWSGHVESWLDQADVPVHLIRYEDLKADTPGVFAAALTFLGETIDRERLERAVFNSRFSELQRQERENGFRERLSVTTPFFRRGEAGSWRNELTPEQVLRIESANQRVMERLGYPTPGQLAAAS